MNKTKAINFITYAIKEIFTEDYDEAIESLKIAIKHLKNN